jgi:hypothetical protein
MLRRPETLRIPWAPGVCPGPSWWRSGHSLSQVVIYAGTSTGIFEQNLCQLWQKPLSWQVISVCTGERDRWQCWVLNHQHLLNTFVSNPTVRIKWFQQ